ncbi:GH92 family glycosyl hydrolase [Salinimicrobium sp. TIG7-5_MAKvit]|uniref:GH92 family glycosyl hydrolase n=1 Tax=Salinimicrobium sp. TIG7-5_MAKvit TaxID=3121289 RepID=UPI003C6DEA46
MNKPSLPLYFILFFAIYSCKNDGSITNVEPEPSPISYVDPFVGTGGHGHTYPGATTPFGMIQLSPNNGISDWDWCSGYHYSDDTIVGFTHLNLSGTGIGDLGDLLFMPVNKEIDLAVPVKSRNDIPYSSKFDHANEEASPGFYRVFLDDHEVEVFLTASKRTGYQKYIFREGDEQTVVVDLGFAINWDRPTESSIELENPTTISGYRYSTGWANNQKVFFVAEFSKPIVDANFLTDGKVVDNHNANGVKTAAQFFFDTETGTNLQVKLALSSVSIENAKENLDANDFNFDKRKEEATAQWAEALETIKIQTPVDSLKAIFYSALYHTKLAPVTFSDKNGEFRKENDEIIKAGDYTAYSTFSLWDTFRAQHPLLTLTDPEKVPDMIRSLLEYYKTENILPVWTLYGNETNTMTGYHSVPVIAEAYFKGIRDFDVEFAYEAMKNTMMQDERGLDLYKEYGFIPYNLLDESVTITLEYAYNDWAVAQMAQALGKNEDYRYFSQRAKAYQELFDSETGFMRGKTKDGVWNEPFDPKFSNHREHTDYTEGNAWQHSWFVLHEPEAFVALHGQEKFSERLEQLFTESSEITGDNVSADISGLIGQYAHGNEPSHHIAYLFNKANQPWRTQYWVREILKTQYSTQPDGLSGNEDAGQMSAWFVLSSMGIYPLNPVSAQYEIGSPLFEESVIQLQDGKSFKIIAEDVSDVNIYIQSAQLNGTNLDRTFITHDEILQGGELHFKMGPEPNLNWGINNTTAK